MTWEFFLTNAIIPAMSAGVALLISIIISKNKKNVSSAGVVETVKSSFSELKLEIQKMFTEFKSEFEEKIEKQNEKNEHAHKEFYGRHETHVIEIAVLKNEIAELKRQHDKNHGG